MDDPLNNLEELGSLMDDLGNIGIVPIDFDLNGKKAAESKEEEKFAIDFRINLGGESRRILRIEGGVYNMGIKQNYAIDLTGGYRMIWNLEINRPDGATLSIYDDKKVNLYKFNLSREKTDGVNGLIGALVVIERETLNRRL